jgi:hypothetical protein
MVSLASWLVSNNFGTCSTATTTTSPITELRSCPVTELFQDSLMLKQMVCSPLYYLGYKLCDSRIYCQLIAVMEAVGFIVDEDSSQESRTLLVVWFSFIVMTLFCIAVVGADNFRIKICKPGNSHL